MFFPNLMHIKRSDTVLEIGPGAYPFWRSDCLADKFDENTEIDLKQFGGKPMDLAGKPLFKIKDNKLPFKDNSFDYIICSHVLEHVPYLELPLLVNEINRVSKRKYIEFPTFVYDYIYDFNVHVNLMDIVDGTIICLPKEKSGLSKMGLYTEMLMHLRDLGKFPVERSYPELCIIGKEYSGDIPLKIVESEKEFFDIIKNKYKKGALKLSPSFIFKCFNRSGKIIRGFLPEKPASYFANKIS